MDILPSQNFPIMTKHKITIVDDEQLFKAGMKVLLEQEQDFEVNVDLSNGQELLDKIHSDEWDADVVLLDLSMPVLDGIDTLKIINQEEINLRIIVLSSHYNDSLILRLLDEGVSGFLAKNENPEELIHTVRKVAESGFHINDYILNLIRNRRLISKRKHYNENLTCREHEIIQLICQELTTKEIANQLNISPRTVDGHRNRLLEKINCKNIAGVVVYAIEHNLIEVNTSKYK